MLLTCLRKIPYRPVGLKMTLSLRCTLEPRWKNEVLPSRRRCIVAIGYQYPTCSLKTSFCKQRNWNWEEMFIDNRQSPEQPKSVKKLFLSSKTALNSTNSNHRTISKTGVVHTDIPCKLTRHIFKTDLVHV